MFIGCTKHHQRLFLQLYEIILLFLIVFPLSDKIRASTNNQLPEVLYFATTNVCELAFQMHYSGVNQSLPFPLLHSLTNSFSLCTLPNFIFPRHSAYSSHVFFHLFQPPGCRSSSSSPTSRLPLSHCIRVDPASTCTLAI